MVAPQSHRGPQTFVGACRALLELEQRGLGPLAYEIRATANWGDELTASQSRAGPVRGNVSEASQPLLRLMPPEQCVPPQNAPLGYPTDLGATEASMYASNVDMEKPSARVPEQGLSHLH